MANSKKIKIPTLPSLIDRKIYKTGQTRGADDDEIYQNRVSRKSTVLMPYPLKDKVFSSLGPGEAFEKGYIALISPSDYFTNADNPLVFASQGLSLGENMLIFYERREDWLQFPPSQYGFTEAVNREAPLGGQYVARIPATTSSLNGQKISLGFHTTKPKGAGIRYYEYATEKTIAQTRVQLETLFWLCHDAVQVASNNGMTAADALLRSNHIISKASAEGLLDYGRLKKLRIVNARNETVCPLCLEALSAKGFFSKMEQAEGREVSDLTITQLNLFHIEELRLGELNHRIYNLGWGHHHCNVVVKDAGIVPTIKWMNEIVEKNKALGYL